VFAYIFKLIKFPSRKDRKFYCLIKKICGISPRNLHFYRLAFLHKSVIRRDTKGFPLNNERLEYLGDAVLSAIVADELYRRFPEKDEGTLSKMRSSVIKRGSLNQFAIKLKLLPLIQSQSLVSLKKTHIPGDTLEALIGAIYLDRGYKKAGEFVRTKILDQNPDMLWSPEKDNNYKSMLIEWGQKNRLPIHFIAEELVNHPSNQLLFFAKVIIDGKLVSAGEGSSKKEAQQNAACNALEYLSKVGQPNLN